MKNREDFEEHTLWTTLEQIEAKDDLIAELPSDTRKYLQFLIDDLKKRKSKSQAYYLSASRLDSLESNLNRISGYVDNEDSARVDQYVAACFDELSSNWPANYAKDLASITESTIDSISNNAQRRIAEADKAADKVADLSQSYEEHSDALKSAFDSQSQEINSNLGALQEETSQALKELETETQQSLENLQNHTTQETDAIQKSFEESLGDIKSEAESILDDVKTTANAIAGHVIADNYGKYARNCAVSRVIYDLIAIVFSIGALFLVAWTLTEVSLDATSTTVFKLALSVAAFTVSGFLFRRGSFLFKESKVAKRTELTLKSYKSYIATLPETNQEKISMQIAERIFIKGDLGDDKSSLNLFKRDELSDKDIEKVVKLLETATKIAGSAN